VASGEILTGDSDRWHRGTESVVVSASDDGAGIAEWRARIDGDPWLLLGEQPCAGDRGAFAVSLVPCPLGATRQFSIDTRSMSSGSHTIEFCARDYGAPRGNLGCSVPRMMRVDNEAPLQPENLTVAGGEDTWHADNDFDLDWANPPQADGAPIAAVRYRMLDAGGSVVVPQTRVAGPASNLMDLEVPAGPGRYTVEVSLEDSAGNVGPAARAVLRFDDVRPGPAAPVETHEWLSRSELPLFQSITHPPLPHPVSGIAGYAYAVDQSPTTDPCAAGDRCTASETDLKSGVEDETFQISDLVEGTNYVHSVAVSGSGMKSSEVGHAELLVDKTDPVTTLHGVPSGWTTGNVPLTATATDSLSGMGGGAEAGAYTAISVDGGPAVTSGGDSVSTVVTGEGVHTVSHFAGDVAGNANDGRIVNGVQNRPPGAAVVRIDRTEPGVAFVSNQDPDDPERLRAVVSDALSGPSDDGGGIEVRRVGGARTFQPIPTEVDHGVLEARWNSDDYPAGEYEFRAWATDVAGNTAVSRQRTDGKAMVLPNPIKVPTAVRAGLGPGRSRLGRIRSKSVSYSSGVRFHGRLTAGLGSPLAGQTVEVTERFRPGARLATRISRVRTGGKGFFSMLLPAGPGRTVTAAYAGTRTLTRSISAPSRIRTAGRITLRVSSRVAWVGGRPIVFSGTIGYRLAAIPRDGKRVDLQFRTRSVGWTSFRSIESNARGHFRFAYRFVDDESRGVAFDFRALAPAERDWPYGAAVSSSQRVRGR